MSALIERAKSVSKIPPPILVFSKVTAFVWKMTQIVVGALYVDECPREPYVPVFLVVMGVSGLVLAVLSCLPCAEKSQSDPPNPLHRVCTIWNSIMSFFCFCWFIAGSVWVYSIYEPNFDKNADIDTYCNKTVYLVAFWSITLTYVLVVGGIVGACLYFCVYGDKNTED